MKDMIIKCICYAMGISIGTYVIGAGKPMWMILLTSLIAGLICTLLPAASESEEDVDD